MQRTHCRNGHPESRRRDGKCLQCRSEANSRYAHSLVMARRKLRAIEDALSA